MNEKADIQSEKYNYQFSDIVDAIKYHIDNQMIMKVERKSIDKNEIMGFPLAMSKELLLMSQVIDFRDNGCLIIRLKDITDAYSLDSNNFYEYICRKEKVREIAQEENPVENIVDIQSVLNGLIKFKGFVSIQCELEDNELYYVIGKVIEVKKCMVEFQDFDMNGKWSDETLSIPIDKITMIGLNDSYSKMFYKYMNK